MPIYRYIDRLIPSRGTTELLSNKGRGARRAREGRGGWVIFVVFYALSRVLHFTRFSQNCWSMREQAHPCPLHARLALDTTRLRDDSLYLLNPAVCRSYPSHLTFHVRIQQHARCIPKRIFNIKKIYVHSEPVYTNAFFFFISSEYKHNIRSAKLRNCPTEWLTWFEHVFIRWGMF